MYICTYVIVPRNKVRPIRLAEAKPPFSAKEGRVVSAMFKWKRGWRGGWEVERRWICHFFTYTPRGHSSTEEILFAKVYAGISQGSRKPRAASLMAAPLPPYRLWPNNFPTPPPLATHPPTHPSDAEIKVQRARDRHAYYAHQTKEANLKALLRLVRGGGGGDKGARVY